MSDGDVERCHVCGGGYLEHERRWIEKLIKGTNAVIGEYRCFKRSGQFDMFATLEGERGADQAPTRAG